ncbi:Cell number regulator 6 [Cardamine amara subsp. amara]|uniref:Cell number regulator 6 n=1 Tax=Cardamine amara subsp. amara TaxID=228776 RepID=A0ABD1AKT0_CARAN
MAEGNAASRYVKLRKEQAPVEDITPGELNQPIDVPQLNVRKCHECMQVLPESYEPPSDENWTTGIFGCAEDPESCRTGLFCPCVLFGRNIEAVREEIPWTQPCVCHAICIEGGMALAAVTALFSGYIDPQTTVVICEGLFFAWWMCGIYSGLFRQELQKKYHLKNAPCDHCMVHCCLHWCALCQEHREMKNHLSDAEASSSTTMDPPPVQEMNTEEKKDASSSSSSSSPSSAKSQHNDLEMVPL